MIFIASPMSCQEWDEWNLFLVVVACTHFVSGLNYLGIIHFKKNDSLVWEWNKYDRQIRAKCGY